MTHRLTGQILQGTYRIERRLGAGGMGEVYQASHLRLARSFAVKLLFVEMAEYPEALARFRREAEITSALGHPHIVEVVDFNKTDEGAPYIVMELLEGEDLDARLKRAGRLDLLPAASIFRQAASALEVAHGRGIIHRDLKPPNLFLCRRGNRDDFVKVVDFGISKVLGSASIVTRAHSLMGTPHYMSPEQAEERIAEIDLHTDVFAMGTILYQMLTGELPFSGASIPALLLSIVQREPPPLRSRRPDLPAAVEQVIATALRKNPAERYASMAEFWRDLAHAAGLARDELDEATEDWQLHLPRSRPAAAGARAVAPPREPAGAYEPTVSSGIKQTTLSSVASELRRSSPATLDERPPRTPIRRRQRLVIVLGATALGVALVAGGLGLYLRRDRSSTPVPPARSALAPRPGSTPAPAAARKLDPPAATRPAVQIHLRLSPRSARVLLDGVARAENPLLLPPDSKHRLRIEARGYEAAERDLAAREDQTIEVALKSARAGAARRPARKPIPAATERPARKPIPASAEPAEKPAEKAAGAPTEKVQPRKAQPKKGWIVEPDL